MKAFLSTALIVGLLFSGAACTTTKDFKVATTADKGPILFQISKDGQSHHILGTIHLGVNPKNLDPAVWQRFNKSRQFVSELSLADTDPNKVAMFMLAKPGNGLKQVLDPTDWQKLVAQLNGIVPAQVLERFNTYAAHSLLLGTVFPSSVSIDLTFMSEAKRKQMKTYALETASFQINLLKGVMTVDSLKFMINNPEQNKAQYQQMAEAYKKGKLLQIWQLMIDPQTPELKIDPSNFSKLITDRNQDWSRKLPNIFAKGSTFVAVGAGHLPGDQGLLSLLAQQGYKINRVPAKTQ